MYLIDIHCHIVPGVDDGSDSLSTSLELIKRQYNDGVRAIIATPHFRRGMFETSDEIIIDKFNRLKEAAAKEFPDLELYLGREFHAYTDMIPDFTEGKKEAVTLGGSKYVLLEFSAEKSLHYIKARTEALLDEGYFPIIAHIERYPNIVRNPDFVYELIKIGAKIQVNASTLLGADGWTIKGFAKNLLKNGLIDYIATDCHDLKHRAPNLKKAADYVRKKAGEDAVDRIFYENPMNIIEDMPQ